MRIVHSDDILSFECDALAVPTCAYLYFDATWNRTAYVDDGVGGMLATEFPEIRYAIVRINELGGNTVGLMTGNGRWRDIPMLTPEERRAPYHLINFPSKPGYVYIQEEGLQAVHPFYHAEIDPAAHRVPGYMSRARLGIVEESVKELVLLVNETEWGRIGIPEFEEPEINEYLKRTLDDRFILIR